MAVTVELNDLRVGMFVHLDVGWMSHPFPLSSFKITSPDQIATIRGLGLKKLRWSPDRSDALLVATPRSRPESFSASRSRTESYDRDSTESRTGKIDSPLCGGGRMGCPRDLERSDGSHSIPPRGK